MNFADAADDKTPAEAWSYLIRSMLVFDLFKQAIRHFCLAHQPTETGLHISYAGLSLWKIDRICHR
jgi:hypothetical protein